MSSAIYLSTIAVQNAADSMVRVFVEKLLNDHAKLNEELRAIAERKEIALPTSLNPQVTPPDPSRASGARPPMTAPRPSGSIS